MVYKFYEKTELKQKSFAGFPPLQKPKSLNDMAYESIKGGILTGKLVTGEVYSELELARWFKISRTPVREALLRLSAEKLIIFHPKRGISVSYFDKKDIENLFELRQAIEEMAFNKLLTNLSKDQIQTAKKIIGEQENCIKNNYDENLFLEMDRKFHLFFVEICGNRFMVQTYNGIRDYITISARKALFKKGRANEVIDEHKAILEALSKGDARKIRESLKRHLITSKMAALEGLIDNR